MTNIDRDQLRKMLQERVAVVTFTKKNGDERIMQCTTNFNIIPEGFHPKAVDQDTKPTVEPNPNLFKVFDVDKNGWRSFNYDQVTAWHVLH